VRLQSAGSWGGGEGACLHVAQGARVNGEDVDSSTDQKPQNNGDERLGHGAQSSHGSTHYAYEDGAQQAYGEEQAPALSVPVDISKRYEQPVDILGVGDVHAVGRCVAARALVSWPALALAVEMVADAVTTEKKSAVSGGTKQNEENEGLGCNAMRRKPASVGAAALAAIVFVKTRFAMTLSRKSLATAVS